MYIFQTSPPMHFHCYFAALLLISLFVFVAITSLGDLLFVRLHHVTPSVSHMARVALLFMCAYPLFDMTVSVASSSLITLLATLFTPQAWLHVGILLQWHYSSMAGITSLADILTQVHFNCNPVQCRNQRSS